ncbi:MAG: AtpZ/AtpI family protein [Bacteroidales bacterium]|nr:AtpZ/AtpI family protein [Bacteroidales bacterium]
MPKPEKPLPDFFKYSSMAFQMGIIIFGSAWAGIELDKFVERISFPLFTVLFVLLGVFAALYLTLKDFFNSNHKN